MLTILTRCALVPILAAGAMHVATTAAYACRCTGPQTPQSAFHRADVVVVAKVLTVVGNFEAEGGAIATLETSKAWKASIPATVRVETRTTCAFNFHAGETYLVYLNRSAGRAPYSTTICNGNLPARDAAMALRWLDQHASPSQVAQ